MSCRDVASSSAPQLAHPLAACLPPHLPCCLPTRPALRQVSDTVVEPYNATLSVHQLVENADECMILVRCACCQRVNNSIST